MLDWLQIEMLEGNMAQIVELDGEIFVQIEGEYVGNGYFRARCTNIKTSTLSIVLLVETKTASGVSNVGKVV